MIILSPCFRVCLARKGEANGKQSAASGPIAGRNLPTMRLHNALADGQIRTELQFGFRDTRPEVPHHQNREAALPSECQFHRGLALCSVFQGVVEHVMQDKAHALPLAEFDVSILGWGTCADALALLSGSLQAAVGSKQ